MKTRLSLAIISLILMTTGMVSAQAYLKDAPFAHTFSIVARDEATGEMAVAVQSHWFSVGTIVSWGKSGIGVVATQSFVNPSYGPLGLELMEKGKTAGEALEYLSNQDEGKDFRQVAMIDSKGFAAAFTGAKCISSAAHFTGKGYSVQANMMLNDKVVPAMSRAYETNIHLPLAERMVETLKAAQAAGGDIRGKQSAVLIVVGALPAENEWSDRLIDLRVDDSNEPIRELERLLKVHRAYEHMNNGDLAIEHNDMSLALQEYGAAEKMFPHNLEMKYWKAVALANSGNIGDALQIFREIFREDDNWRELTRRLPASGLLTVPGEQLDKILKLK